MNKLILNFKSKDSKKIKNPKNFLGGKGANLFEMGRMGLPVPPGFTISTKVCEIFYKDKKKLNSKLISQIKKEIKVIEKDVSKKFGDFKNPLLLSVRSGARVSMPGMMDTILNLGLNDKTVVGLANKTSNGRFAKDSYRRFIQMYGNVVMGVESYYFEELIENFKLTKGVLLDTDLDEQDWDGLIKDFKNVVKEKTNKDFPQDVYHQLIGAINAVFLSWESKRAKVYRKLNQIPSEWGTAVNVQSMVFGNMGNDCATGVVFTRNPSDGSNDIYGEYLINAQGEDVVAGTRTPRYITKRARKEAKVDDPSMEESMPKVYYKLYNILKKLEKHYKDMQDVEFTVESNKLWILQTRSDKEISEVANAIGSDKKEIESRIEELHEQNPMLGHRGCRLGISFPEIYEMQCRAIFEALADLKKSKQKFAFPEIMIPLVSTEAEIKIMKNLVINIARKVQKENKTKIEFIVGTMIELPRAAIKAKDIAKHAEFFSFGTNDLTQTTFGISRDDSGKFLNDYIDNKIFAIDPFVSIDDGVKDLVEIAVNKGKKQNRNIKLGICGEHGGDPESILFCSQAGLDYVSCSPYRVPIARLAAAQAELKK